MISSLISNEEVIPNHTSTWSYSLQLGLYDGGRLGTWLKAQRGSEESCVGCLLVFFRVNCARNQSNSLKSYTLRALGNKNVCSQDMLPRL